MKRSAKSIKPPGGIYSKSESATANLREAKAIAANETYPAFVAARFALVLAILSFIVSAAALAVAVAK